jgi:ABC-type multidrug transport system ATPase subunit
MNKGRLLASGNLEDLRKRLSSGLRLKIRILGAFSTEQLGEIEKLTGVIALKTVQNDIVQLEIEAEGVIPDVVKSLVQRGIPILEVQPEQQSLEEIYFTLQREAEGATL